MRRLIMFIGVVILLSLFMSRRIVAQGLPMISTLERTTLFGEPVAADRWLSADFFTGENPGGYRLDVVQVLLEETSGIPGGLRVILFDRININIKPVTIIGEFSDSDPDTEVGLLTLRTSDIILSPSSRHSIGMTADTQIETGSYSWAISGSGEIISFDNEWWADGSYYESADGMEWHPFGRRRLKFAIYATPIPAVSIITTDDQIELHWEGFEGVTYQVQARASLTDSEWTDVGELLTGGGSEITVPAPVTSGESQSYYRVEVLPAEPASE